MGARNSWTLDIEAKQKVWSAFRPLLSSIEDASYSTSLTPEMLDIAYEQYIVHHHSISPLIHLPSFCPRNAPVSLLVAMCTIGLSVMGTGDLNKLVSKIFPDLLRMASDDLHASSAGDASLMRRLTAMMTGFLVLTLASVIGHKRRITQTESLYVSLLSNAHSDGLFSANEYPPSLVGLTSIPSEERRWRVWGSIESVKRLILHLVQLDCWYSSYLAVDPTLRPECVHLIPTCDEALFQASTLDKWSRMRPDFGQMDYPVISASYYGTPMPSMSFDMNSTLLMLLQLRFAAASTILDRAPRDNESQFKLLPWKIFTEDARHRSLVNLTVDLAKAADAKDRSFDMNNAISWHAFCMMLGANLPLFETAAGRSGPTTAAQALKDISNWAFTSSARRSCIHAAHIFNLLLNRRVSDPVKLHSIIALFQASLVLGLYIFAIPTQDSTDLYNLYDDVDWVSLGSVGLSDLSEEIVQPGSTLAPATRFILRGGGASLSDFMLKPGYTQACKCWLHFASLMLGLGRWKSRSFSRILHVMCNNLSDMDPNNFDDGQ
ncbi:hypothetical protein BKA56DRAFT_488082 [Ilyonectria sp. MPI-CAGE-AT-0026]|nr:hypothetical protein BKA56DRAFT_488082 [Ilyonectria sp. MPI-CAGE-AT-0026]